MGRHIIKPSPTFWDLYRIGEIALNKNNMTLGLMIVRSSLRKAQRKYGDYTEAREALEMIERALDEADEIPLTRPKK
jgi:hypothetical protein